MKTLKYWAYRLVLDIGLVAMFYLGVVQEDPGATRVLLFVLWGIFTIAFLTLFAKTTQRKEFAPENTAAAKWYRALTKPFFVLALVWVGWLPTAIAYGFGLLVALQNSTDKEA